MKSFGNIGKAVLAKALGLQKNYSEVIESTQEVIDVEASGCEACKWHSIKSVTREGEELYSECCRACEACPHRLMKTVCTYKKKYCNETNQFGGYLPRLKTNAIKLFLAYHLLDVDRYGFVRGADPKELAGLLNCDVKTIHNNNELLREYGYISYAKADNGRINLYLPDYENYFKPASSGGRGFLVVSEGVFEELLKIESINELRLTLRQLMEFDLLGNHDACSIEKSYKELKRMLPDYCKRNIIQKASRKLTMFVTEIKDTLVKFMIKPEFDAKRKKEEALNFYEQELRTFCKEFTHDVIQLNTAICDAKDSKFMDFFSEEAEEYTAWFLTELEISDLASLCLQYSYNSVMEALASIYRTYRLKNTHISNLGGLARTVIKSMYQMA